MKVTETTFLKLLLLTTFAAAVPGPNLASKATVRTIYQFPNNTWVENLAVRSNGNVLVTLITAPEVWEIDPDAVREKARLIYRFPKALSVLGITEYEPDVFALNVGNFSITTGATPGSWSIWNLSLTSSIEVHKITNIPSAIFLNGITTLPANPSIVLAADSGAGKIYSINTQTGAHQTVISGPALQPNASAVRPIGVNGIQFQPGDPTHLYFDNSLKTPTFARVPIDPSTGVQSGPVEVIYKRPSYPTNLGQGSDDFTLGPSGQDAWVTTGASDSLVKVDLRTGWQEIVVGGIHSEQLVGPTACHFGRSAADVAKGRLYITTDGGLAYPPASGVSGGKLAAVDTVGL